LDNFDRKVPLYPFEYDDQLTLPRDGQPTDEFEKGIEHRPGPCP
jgi:hypothetical protein